MLDIELSKAGKSITCPSCRNEMVVPFDKDKPIKVETVETQTTVQNVELDTEPLNTGMDPKGYFATAAQFWFVSTIGFGLLTWSIVAGAAFGIIFGGIMGILFREETYTLSFEDKSDFIADTNVAIIQIGYKAEEATENMMRYKPGFQAGILAGDIVVIFKGKKASVVGPQIYIKKVVKKIAGDDILNF
jgi:hypothetical protein